MYNLFVFIRPHRKQSVHNMQSRDMFKHGDVYHCCNVTSEAAYRQRRTGWDRVAACPTLPVLVALGSTTLHACLCPTDTSNVKTM